MNKCKDCKNKCCGSKFLGLKESFKYPKPDLFCQLLLSQEEVDRIVEYGGKDFIEHRDGKSYIALNPDNSCKAFTNGKCAIYDVKPDVCNLYPYFFDPFCGIVLDKNCEKYGVEDFNELTKEERLRIFDILKKRLEFFEEEELNKNDEGE